MTKPPPQPEERHRVEVRDSRDDIERVEKIILEEVGKRGYPEASRFALRLALEEALINAFRHGHKDLPKTPVEVEWSVDEHAARITVPSGRGIMLMRAYMSSIEYNDSGNAVTMVYERSKAESRRKR
jgi:serine/threonine-protein kinase RsbW